MKRPILHLLLISVISASVMTPSYARIGSSSSRSTAVSSQSSAQSSRLGAGSSVGMQRPQVMSNVQNGTTPPPIAPASPGIASQPGYAAQPQRTGPGWGTVAGAAAAGAAVGYIAGHSNTPTVIQQGVPVNGGVGGGYYPQQQSGNGAWMLMFLILGGIGLMAYFMYRRASSGGITPLATTNYADAGRDFAIPPIGGGSGSPQIGNARASLLPQAEQLFRNLQKANSDSDHGYLRSHCTEGLYSELAPSVGGGSTFVNTVSCELVDDSAGLASIRYRAVVTEQGGHPEEVDEVWHFVQQGSDWRLAGIEQV